MERAIGNNEWKGRLERATGKSDWKERREGAIAVSIRRFHSPFPFAVSIRRFHSPFPFAVSIRRFHSPFLEPPKICRIFTKRSKGDRAIARVPQPATHSGADDQTPTRTSSRLRRAARE